MDYAVFRTGGKQYRVRPRDVIDVEKLPVDPGALVEMGDVLAISRDGNLQIGQPLVAGARVVAQVQAQTRDQKIIVFKYKRKVRYRRKRGHRQSYTRLAIRELLLEGEEPGEIVDERQETPVALLDDEELVEDGDSEDTVEEPVDELEEAETEEDAGPDDEAPDEEGAP